MNPEAENKTVLRKAALDRGFSLFSVADITSVRNEFNLNEELAAKFDRALSLGKRLLNPILEDIRDRPTPLYFHHYKQINLFLDRGALVLASFIQDKGYQALPIPASQIIDWEKQTSHVSHKKVGLLAGLGWIGRNNLLVNKDYGSRVRLVTVLTDMPLEVDAPADGDCGGCRKCLPVCPVEAIKDSRDDFDHQACFEKLKEFRRSGIVGQYICGICVKACPGKQGFAGRTRISSE